MIQLDSRTIPQNATLSVAIGELTWRSNTVEPFDSIWGVESECNSVASARFIFLNHFKAERPIFPFVNYETPDSGVGYRYGVPSFSAIGGLSPDIDIILASGPRHCWKSGVAERLHEQGQRVSKKNAQRVDLTAPRSTLRQKLDLPGCHRTASPVFTLNQKEIYQCE
jgi:hypothetical protein